MTSGRRVPWLLASRAAEQGVLGIGALLLARDLGPERFAPVALLFVVYSLAVTAGGFGLGIAVLRHPPTRSLARADRRRARQVDGVLATLVGLLGIALGGDRGAVVVVGALLWVVGAEATVAKSVSVRAGRARATAIVEVLSAVSLAAGIAAALVDDLHAVQIVGGALVLKVLIEMLLLDRGRSAFSDSGDHPGHWLVWATVVLAYLIANVDYVAVGAWFAPAALSVYVLSYRLASAVPSQLGNVAVRLSLVDLAGESGESRQQTYDRYVGRLAVAGTASAALTIALAPLVPVVAGSAWRPAVGVIMTLALAIPWRLVLSITGSLALAGGDTGRLVMWEATRLAVVVALLSGAAQVSFGTLVAVVTMIEVVSCVTLHALATRATGLRAASQMWLLAGGSIACIGWMASTISSP